MQGMKKILLIAAYCFFGFLAAKAQTASLDHDTSYYVT
jgi:hypothetical protein